MADEALTAEQRRAMRHALNCPATTVGYETDCKCGLHWRDLLQTEREMHAAWRKRATEAEERENAALSELARLRAEREWKPIAELAELKPALVGLEGEYPTMAWRTKDGRWAVSEFDALQWTPTHYMTLPDEPPAQSHEEKQG